MKQHFDKLNALVAKELPDVKLRIELIEQATIGFLMKPRDRKTGRPGTITLGAGMVRSEADFDWKSLVQAFWKRFGPADTKLTEVRFEGQVYYKATNNSPFGPGLCFYFPDARTVVHLDEEAIRHLIRGGVGSRPEYAQGGDWHKVENDLIAFAIDNKDKTLKLDVATDDPDELLVAPLIQNATRCVFGLGGANSLVVHAIATCGTEQQGEVAARSVEALLSRMRTELSAAKKNPPAGKEASTRAISRLETDLLQACTVRREGAAVDLSVKSQHPAENLITFLLEEAGL